MAEKKKIIFGAGAGIATAVAALLSGLYEKEGGFVDHKSDRGGATRYGVTEQVARSDGYKGSMKEFPKFCYEGETNTCADKIYFETYIEKPGLVPIIQASVPVAEELFDTGVNMGPSVPSKWFQSGLNELCPVLPGKAKLVADGRIGPGTHAYMFSCQAQVGKVRFCTEMVSRLDAKQKDRYYAIVKANPSQKVFLKGWLAHRINNVDLKRCSAVG